MYLARLFAPQLGQGRRGVALATDRGEWISNRRRGMYDKLVEHAKAEYRLDPAFVSFSIHEWGRDPFEPAQPLVLREDSKGSLVVAIPSKSPYEFTFAERKLAYEEAIRKLNAPPKIYAHPCRKIPFKDTIYFRFPVYMINRFKECVLFGLLITSFWFLIENIIPAFQDFWDYFYIYWASVIVYIGLFYLLLLVAQLYEVFYEQIWFSSTDFLKKKEQLYKYRKVSDARIHVEVHYPKVASQFMKISKDIKKFYKKEKLIDYSLVDN